MKRFQSSILCCRSMKSLEEKLILCRNYAWHTTDTPWDTSQQLVKKCPPFLFIWIFSPHPSNCAEIADHTVVVVERSIGTFLCLHILDNLHNLDKLHNLHNLDDLDKLYNLDNLHNLDNLQTLDNLYKLCWGKECDSCLDCDHVQSRVVFIIKLQEPLRIVQ